jgi:hypothetical protein
MDSLGSIYAATGRPGGQVREVIFTLAIFAMIGNEPGVLVWYMLFAHAPDAL